MKSADSHLNGPPCRFNANDVRQVLKSINDFNSSAGDDAETIDEDEECDSISENDLPDLMILQHFVTHANKYCYFERHRKATETDGVTDLVFSPPASLALLRAFPYVLVIDTIYKENRYNIPFCEVLGFTSTGEYFDVACCFISEEGEDNYTWLFNQISELCGFVGVTPNTIVTMTDPDQGLFNAVEQAFPHTKHLLGQHQIYQNIKDRCLEYTCLTSIGNVSGFINACKALFESKTEYVYRERLALLERDWKSKEGVIRYVKETWLTPYKEKTVSAWADKVLHFGTHNMTRLRNFGLDSSVKQLLTSYEPTDSNYKYLFYEINSEIKGQTVSILRSFDQLRKKVPHDIKKIAWFMEYEEVSPRACRIMAQEFECVKSSDDSYPSSKCACQVRVSHGLPCGHEMLEYFANQHEIPLEAIHQFWWQLNLNVDVAEDPSSGARAFIVDLFIMFHEMSIDERMRCKCAVKKILQSCEEPPITMDNDRSEDFFKKFFTCRWYSEAGFFSGEDNTPQTTPHAQFPPGVYSSETSVNSHGFVASKPYVEPPNIFESQKSILRQIKDMDPKNVIALGDLVLLQQLLKNATKHYYFNRHRKVAVAGTDVVTDLVFANPESLAILRVFPYVLIIDATPKDNRYKIPFFEILGITPEGKRFNVACAFTAAEKEDSYLWVLNQISELCSFVRETPKTIVTMTDPNQALFNAVEQAFPCTKHLLGWHHIYKNIEERCVEDMCANNIASGFVSACKNLFESKTEDVYEARLVFMENAWKFKQGLFGYLKQTWLTPYKEKIVSAWTDKALHFDIHTMDRVESALKKRLRTSACSSESVWLGLVDELALQRNAIVHPVDKSQAVNVPHKVKKIGLFKSLLWSSISHKAYKIMVQEYERVKSGDVHPSSCVCPIRVSHGLPCAHEMAKCMADKRLIQLEDLHKFWWTSDDLFFLPDDPSCRARAFVLDLFIRFREMTASEQKRCEFAVNKIMQSVEGLPTSMTEEDPSEDILKKWFSFGWDSNLEDSASEGNTSPPSPGGFMSISSCSSCSGSHSNKFNPSEYLSKPPYIHETVSKPHPNFFNQYESLFKPRYAHETPVESYSKKFNPSEPVFKPPYIHETLPNKPYMMPPMYNPHKPMNDPYVKDPYIRQMPKFNPSESVFKPPYLHETLPNKPYMKPPMYILQKPSNDPYVGEIPNFMVPFVTDFCEYGANGHCGFEAIAAEGVENGWRWVRGDMFKDLTAHIDLYAPIFVHHTVETMLKALAAWTTPAYLPHQRLSIPDMGHIVASSYQLVFVVLGRQECVTFLPLYVADDTDLSDMTELCLVSLQQGSKFIKVTVDKGFPLPPLHPSWARHHRRSADGLDRRYTDRFLKYRWFQGFM